MPLLLLILLWVVVVIGYLANVVKFVVALDGGLTVMFVARAIGFVVAPLGSILGYL